MVEGMAVRTLQLKIHGDPVVARGWTGELDGYSSIIHRCKLRQGSQRHSQEGCIR